MDNLWRAYVIVERTAKTAGRKAAIRRRKEYRASTDKHECREDIAAELQDLLMEAVKISMAEECPLMTDPRMESAVKYGWSLRATKSLRLAMRLGETSMTTERPIPVSIQAIWAAAVTYVWSEACWGSIMDSLEK